MIRRLTTLTLLGMLACAWPVVRAEESAVAPPDAGSLAIRPPIDSIMEAVPDDAALEAAGAVIGAIRIDANDIFDPEKPGENNAIFRAANKLHIDTRERVIRKQLLFRTGDRYSRRLLDESERALRTNGYLYAAEIKPVRYEAGRVDLQVVTRDVWTLRLGLGVGRGGGSNAFRFGIQDENFLGLGKEITVRRSSNVDRTETLFRYRDPNLMGRHGRLFLAYSANSDGTETAAAIDRPFFSFDSRWAVGASGNQSERVDSLYQAGEVVSRFRRDAQTYEAYGGLSPGLGRNQTKRFLFGWTHHEERFAPVPGEAAPADFPQDRVLSYPWVGFELIQDRYVKVTDFDQIQRTEDHNLGREVHARLGYSSTMFGGDRDRMVYSASYAQGFNPGNGQMVFIDAALAGRWAAGPENLVASGGFRYDVRDFGRHVLHASVHGDVASNLDPENQLLLGGDNGLRGYPLRYLSGDRRVLMTVEQRLYTDWHVLKLVHVGGVVFYDAGLAWLGSDPTASNRPFLQDVGFGIRLSSSRASLGGLLKIDVAFPLNAPPGIPSRQLLISTGATF